jgi:hypothetical protein
MSQLAIVEAFSDLTDTRRSAGKRHQQALCFALFTLAVAAGNRGFLAIEDWLKAYHIDLVALFQPDKGRLPSHSTIRRALLRTEYQAYAACLACFFSIQPLPGETIAMDGKVLRGSYEAISDDETVNSQAGIPDFPGLKTLIRVESERQVFRANIIEVSTETRYYVASYLETASAFGQRIRVLLEFPWRTLDVA